MDEIYQKFSVFNPHKPQNDPNILHLETTELWVQQSTGNIKPYSERIDVSRVSEWLEEETRERKGEQEVLMLRLIWVNFNSATFCLGLPKTTKDELVTKFQLEKAYDYLPSTITGINAFPETKNSGSDYETFAFCYLPKLAAIWSHKRSSSSPTRRPVTYGLLLADEKQKGFLQKALQTKWHPDLSEHPMFLAFLFSFMFDLECLKTVNDMKERIRPVEMETWSNRSDDSTLKRAALGELEDAFIDMGNAASKLASVDRKSKSLEGLLNFIMEQVGEAPPTPAGSQQTLIARGKSNGDDLIRHHVSVLRRRHGQQGLDTNFTLKRVQVQMGASESISNFRIAISSHRDASSMKTLAVVTMFFLPGSFISALFSTNCFKWEGVDQNPWTNIGVTPTPPFILYWIITVPLTVLTFILYFYWLHVSWKRRSMLDDLQSRIKKRHDTATLPVGEPTSNGKRMHTMTVPPRVPSGDEEKGGPWIKLRNLVGRNE